MKTTSNLPGCSDPTPTAWLPDRLAAGRLLPEPSAWLPGSTERQPSGLSSGMPHSYTQTLPERK
jgi:hypothetical protein